MLILPTEEITRLSDILLRLVSKVPEMVPLLEDLRRHCMSESTFDETDFRRVLEVSHSLPSTPSPANNYDRTFLNTSQIQAD